MRKQSVFSALSNATHKSLLSPSVAGRERGWWPLVSESFAGAWQRGIFTEPRENLLAFSAVYAAVTMIASDAAKLRLKLVEKNWITGVWQEADHPDFSPVLRKPNRYQSRLQFIESWLISKLLHGNAYILKERNPRGAVVALYVLDPNRVTPLVAPDGGVYYRLKEDHLSQISEDQPAVPSREIIHDRMSTLFHPLLGVSPIYACGASATQGMRIQNNSATFFENMSRPSGVLTAPAQINDETASRLKAHWEQNYTGEKIGKIAVLGDGLRYEAMTIPAGDAQLIEQLRWTVEDVARAFRLPLHRLGAGPAPSLANLEQFEGQYYANCLQVLLEAVELCLDDGLSLPTNYGTEFDLNGLSRMDAGSRFDALSKAVGGGWMSPNEARKREDLPPVTGGDAPFLQQQNWSLEQLARRTPPADAPAPETVRSIDQDKRLGCPTDYLNLLARVSQLEAATPK